MGYTYGNNWFSSNAVVPTFFRHGGRIVFLPNDKLGTTITSYLDYTRREGSGTADETRLQKLSRPKMLTCPLSRATFWTERHQADRDTTHGKSTGRRRGLDECLEGLDAQHPILMFYNGTTFASAEDAGHYVKTLETDHLNAPSYRKSDIQKDWQSAENLKEREILQNEFITSKGGNTTQPYI